MAIQPRLLNFAVCPRCRGKLHDDGGFRLSCSVCQLAYPIRDNVPHLVVDEAADLRSGSKTSVAAQEQAVRFREKRQGMAPRSFYLERNTCKIIGRPPGDPNKTTIMNMDLPLVLDEGTKGIVQQYLRKQFGQLPDATSGETGHFRRTSDVVIEDSSVSRLHAIVFYDGKTVGVLDLVSKNGTFVNGQEVESYLLKAGDVIEVGDTKLVYEG